MSHLEELDESKEQEQSQLGDKHLEAGEEGDIGPMPLSRMEVRANSKQYDATGRRAATGIGRQWHGWGKDRGD